MGRILFVLVSALFFMGCGATEFSGKISPEYGSTGSETNPEGSPPASEVVINPSEGAKYDCGNKKIAICHVPEGNPDNRHTLCLPQPAIEAHLAQHDASVAADDEDYLGECK